MSEEQKNVLTIVLSAFFIGIGLSGIIMIGLFELGYIITRG